MKSLAGLVVFCFIIYLVLEISAVTVNLPSFAPVLSALGA